MSTLPPADTLGNRVSVTSFEPFDPTAGILTPLQACQFALARCGCGVYFRASMEELCDILRATIAQHTPKPQGV